jgi:uncharacterized protein (DUF305 family)
MNRFRPLILTALVFAMGWLGHDLAGSIGPAASQTPHHQPASPSESDMASTRAFKEAAIVMHRDMDIAYTGEADKDFAAAMIPHHRGAIAMAKIVLQYGGDSEIRRLAEQIIASQEKEVVFLLDWLTHQH